MRIKYVILPFQYWMNMTDPDSPVHPVGSLMVAEIPSSKSFSHLFCIGEHHTPKDWMLPLDVLSQRMVYGWSDWVRFEVTRYLSTSQHLFRLPYFFSTLTQHTNLCLAPDEYCFAVTCEDRSEFRSMISNTLLDLGWDVQDFYE